MVVRLVRWSGVYPWRRENPMTEHQAIHSVSDLAPENGDDFPLSGRSSAPPPAGNSLATFRTLAAERDAALSQSFDLSRLWLELCRGTWRFRDTFPTENRY